MPRPAAPAAARQGAPAHPIAQRVLSELRGERVDHWPSILQNVSLPDVADRLAFDPERYTRTLLAADDHAELLLMGWLPGQSSAIHDHGLSEGVGLVLAGEAREDAFEPAGDGAARRTATRTLRRGQWTIERRTDVHRVMNPTTSLLVTLHAYAPRLASYQTYDE